jgi:large subunit ribosomal protein L21
MYAVIETGGKQYRVEVGTQLEVERLDAEAGESISFERVLLVADGDDAAIGRPVVADAQVSAEVLRQGRGDKLIVFKYRPKARRRVKKGHRQDLTVLRISDIVFGGKSAAEDVRKAEEAAQADRQRLEEAAARQAAEDAAVAAKLAARTAPKSEPEAGTKTRGRRKATAETAAASGSGAAEATKGSASATGKAAEKAPATRTRKATAAGDSAGKSQTKASAAGRPASKSEAASKRESASKSESPSKSEAAADDAKATSRREPRTKKDE